VIVFEGVGCVSLTLPKTTTNNTVEGFGQLLMAYYVGNGEETLESGGVNSISIEAYDPLPLATTSNCDFTDPLTPCFVPVAGDYKNLRWALNLLNITRESLSRNTSPVRQQKPTIFFNFVSAHRGKNIWDEIFSDPQKSLNFGKNSALLVNYFFKALHETVNVGIDLYILDTRTNLTYFEGFIKSFRERAPYEKFPLILDSLSGLPNNGSSDHFKVGLMQRVGPKQKGINYLNMMVHNADASCSDMVKWWLDPVLDFIPPSNKMFGVWGEILPYMVLHNPGCTDGLSPLFPWMKKNSVNIGIFRWWIGPHPTISALIRQIRASSELNARNTKKKPHTPHHTHKRHR